MRFPMIRTLVNLVTILTVGLLEKLFILLYLLLPIGAFMFVMQMRDKNNKTTAISTFTNDRSEFQFIFPNYILVAVEPNTLKANINKKVLAVNKFLDKYKWFIFFISVFFLILFLLLLVWYFLKQHSV